MNSANYVLLASDDTHDDEPDKTATLPRDHPSTANSSYPVSDVHSSWSNPMGTEAHPSCHNYKEHSAEYADARCRHCNFFYENSSWCELSEWFFQPQIGRENHLYFGCCCDVRRAVVAIDLLTILLLFGLLVSFEVYVRIMHEPLGNLTEEIFPEGWHSIHRNHFSAQADENHAIRDASSPHHGHLFLYILQQYMDVWILVGIILHSLGVYGAIKFESWAVQVAAIAHAVPLVLSVIYFSPLVFVVSTALCMYPHFVLLKEIKEGVMTPYKYEYVSACCVCV